jgi:putative nucleotidyltransferase with HDIG domain
MLSLPMRLLEPHRDEVTSLAAERSALAGRSFGCAMFLDTILDRALSADVSAVYHEFERTPPGTTRADVHDLIVAATDACIEVAERRLENAAAVSRAARDLERSLVRRLQRRDDGGTHRATIDEIDAAIDVIVVRMDAGDPLTAEHSRAVSAWSERIARHLGLDDAEVAQARRAGLIHDIGKVATPREILHAPRSLTDAEMAVMRDHVNAGARLVAGDARLRTFVSTIRGHHERIDGRGYPDGVRGEAITLCTRIVSVADSFNAMIGRRPYRAPWAPTDALEELHRNRSTQFDPDVVDALTAVLDRHGE